MTTMAAQLGVADEGTWGTETTVTKFYEFNSEGIVKEMGRVESKGLRRTRRFMGDDNWMPYVKGAAGPVTMDVPTKGWAWWLKHMLGAVATSTATDSNYTHTGTIASLLADSFSLQVNRPFHPSGTDQAFSYSGGKVASWELGCDVEGLLVFTANCDFKNESTATALASASYASDFRQFSFVGASVTIGGSAIDVTNVKFAGDNKLKTDRHFLRTDSTKKEQVENDFREVTWEMGMDFESLTQYNRFVSATAAGAMAAITATFDGPIAHGGTTVPRIVVTIPAARFDSGSPTVPGPEALTQTMSGIAMDNGTDSPITITYRSTDATP